MIPGKRGRNHRRPEPLLPKFMAGDAPEGTKAAVTAIFAELAAHPFLDAAALAAADPSLERRAACICGTATVARVASLYLSWSRTPGACRAEAAPMRFDGRVDVGSTRFVAQRRAAGCSRGAPVASNAAEGGVHESTRRQGVYWCGGLTVYFHVEDVMCLSANERVRDAS